MEQILRIFIRQTYARGRGKRPPELHKSFDRIVGIALCQYSNG